MGIQPGRQFRDTSGFKRIELAPQDPREVRKVVAAGEEKSRAKRRMSDSEYESQLRDLAASERASGRASEAAEAKSATEERMQAHAQRLGRKFGGNVSPSQIHIGKPAADTSHSEVRSMSAREEHFLRAAQSDFEKSGPGPAKEAARAKVGRALQRGVPNAESITQLACQSPGCGNSINLAHGGDVVCEGCMKSGGDKAGATYTDRVDKVAGTNVSGARRNRGPAA